MNFLQQRFDLTWSMLLIAVSVGVGLFFALMLVRRIAVWVLGPIFEFETVRLARKGHTFRLRTYFVLAMFALLYLSSPGTKFQWMLDTMVSAPAAGSESTDERSSESEQLEMERFATSFTATFLLVLGVGALAITPMYLATAVTEEKATRMLDFLLGTQFTTREIILGKFAARLLPVAGTLAAGVPILFLTELWGGVDWRQIAFGLTVILIAMTSIAAGSILCSVVFSRSRPAIAASYLVLLLPEFPLFLVGSRFSTIELLRHSGEIFYAIDGRMIRLDVVLAWLLMYASAHLVFACVCLVLAVYCLRPFALRHQQGARRVVAATPPGERPKRRLPSSRTIAPNPPIGGDPIVWKERYVGRTTAGVFASKAGWAVVYVVFGSILVSAIFLRTMDMGNMIADWASLIRAVVILIGTFTLGSLSLRLLSSVSREREQQTLTTLLTLPIVPKHLLFAKWTGTLFRSRAALIGVILAFITIGIAGSIDVHAWCLLPLAYAAHLCFFGNLALLLSVLCRSTTVAYILFAAIVAVLIGGAWMISILEPTPPRPPGLPPAWTGTDDEWEEHRPATTNDWLNPPQTWWRLTAHSRVAMPYKYANPLRKTEFDLPGTDWFGWRRIALAALGFMTVGVLFWWLATRIFRRQQVR